VNPHIAIVGAGSVGCYLGGRLNAHARVTFIARPRIAAAIAAHGLTLSDLRGYREHIEPPALTVATDIHAAATADLILITVKSGATSEVGDELAGALPRPSLIVSFQNGLHNAQRLRERLPQHRVLAGMVPFNVLQQPPASFHQGSSGEIMAQRDPDLAPFLPAFHSAGLELQQRDDMAAVQNAKLLLNLNNAINALSDLPLREELSQRAWRRCLAMAQQEALRIFETAGMPTAQLTPLSPRMLILLLKMPDWVFRRAASRMLAIDPLARSSMWEDLRAGRPTEIDAIQGEVVALATAHGTHAPINAELANLVRNAERQRVPLRGAEVLRALKSAVRHGS
jgi:2-dehydropantoate 2-reductase